MSGCRLCDALALSYRNPVVARLADRLRDELTVLELLKGTPRYRIPPSVRSKRLGVDPRSSSDQRQKLVAALAGGPMRVCECVEELFGPPVADQPLQRLRIQRTRMAILRALRERAIRRVGHGWYATAGDEDGMTHTTRGDCLRLLQKATPRGLTVKELVEELDQKTGTIQLWLRDLFAQHTEMRRTPEITGRGGWCYRYRLEA